MSILNKCKKKFRPEDDDDDDEEEKRRLSSTKLFSRFFCVYRIAKEHDSIFDFFEDFFPPRRRLFSSLHFFRISK